jgi:hypothetical protein
MLIEINEMFLRSDFQEQQASVRMNNLCCGTGDPCQDRANIRCLQELTGKD